jgi:prepilin-type N-terminal cleavage/methylation domain-containing protein
MRALTLSGMRASTGRPAARPRAFTLVEVMAALVLVAIGFLGIAGSTTIAFRATVAQAKEQRAIRRASLRLARLAASGCAIAHGGSAADPAAGLNETWEVDAPAAGFALVREQVEWVTAGGTRHLALRSALWC